MRKWLVALSVVVVVGCDRPSSPVTPQQQSELMANVVNNRHESSRIKHVLLISVDGFHAIDLRRYVATHQSSTLAKLSRHGETFFNGSTSKPSDSWPGILAITTGGSPKTTGIIYEVSYDHALSPPGTNCSTVGTVVDFSEFVDINSTLLNGGGGINPNNLPRDPNNGCSPVYPHQYLRVNTIFEVAKNAGFRTAWSDKSLGYEVVNGPSGHGVDDLFDPEIAAPLASNGQIPTTNVADCEQYDSIKVQAILNEIAGHDHTGQGNPGTPGIFGMNFQTVSVGQKTAGYLDAAGTPSTGLAGALDFIDQSLGKFVSALDRRGLLESTLIVVSAKHGQAPVNPALRRIVDDAIIPTVVDSVSPNLVAATTEDDIGLVWLTQHSHSVVEAAVDALQADRAALGINSILSGDALADQFNSVRRDSRAPDIIVVPNEGVIYAGPTATKLSEHGGFSHDDTNVPILVSWSGGRGDTFDEPVETKQIAPTILEALGLDAGALDAVRAEGTRALPIDFDTRRVFGR
jgi:type I phosphodiesterase/nucleotide pyrophosphatase